jgi:hypothetical protein
MNHLQTLVSVSTCAAIARRGRPGRRRPGGRGRTRAVGPTRNARHVIGFHLIRKTRVYNVGNDVGGIKGLTDNACHLIGFHLALETRGNNVDDDVACILYQALCLPRHVFPFDSRNEGIQCGG